MEYRIRPIAEGDNAGIEAIIRDCLTEYGAPHEGTAWADPMLGCLSEVYQREGDRYWVAETPEGVLLGGAGIGAMEGEDGVCELQKLYCVPAARGTGVGAALLHRALAFAAGRYRRCNLETLENMLRARRFYEKHGFRRTEERLGSTGHYACPIRYILDLTVSPEGETVSLP